MPVRTHARARSTADLANIAEKLILDRFAPASVLVNGAGEALYFCGPTEDYLRRPRGVPSGDLLAMLRAGLRAPVRAALDEAAASDLPVTVGDARMRCSGGYAAVQLSVTPCAGGTLGRLFLLVFGRPQPLPPADDGAALLLRRFGEELETTRDDLHDCRARLASAAAEGATAEAALRTLGDELERVRGDAERARADARVGQLRADTDQLRTLSAALAMAEEHERRVLAQDLHDDLGQILAVVKLKVSALDRLKMSPAVRQAMQECAGAVDQANRKLRAMAFQLSPPMLHERGLLPALDWMADEMRHVYHLEVRTVDDDQPKPLDPAVSATLFRAVRELLINVARHAGVDTATVSTARDGNQVVITVSDAGAGFDPDALQPGNGIGGFGLLSIRERIGYLGGEVRIQSNPGDGTSVVLTAPLLAAAGSNP